MSSQGNTGLRMALQIESEERPADGHVRRIKDLSLFFFGILVLATVVGYSLTVLAAECVAEEDRRWATSTLTAVFGGMLGWLIKR